MKTVHQGFVKGCPKMNEQKTHIQEKLRDAASKVRSKSMPLSDFIPLLQEAADAFDRLAAASVGNNIINDLDTIGRAHCQFEYGLPVHDDVLMLEMRQAIRDRLKAVL
jgi:hypothetical protein